MKTSILIALLHNNDKVRYQKIKPNLDKLRKDLSGKYFIEIKEFSKQPEVIPHPLMLTLFRKSIYWKLNRDWEKYKGFKNRNILLDLGVLAVRLINTTKNQKRENQRGVIETFLVDKHIRAWNYFSDSNNNLLIVFEDDAVFKKDSIQRLKQVLEKASKTKPIYLDLAGGNSPEINRVDRLQIKTDNLGKYYKKPVTNTACCYLINKKTSEIFLQYLLKHSWLRLVGGDWLMNKIFVMTESKYKYFCLHTEPTIFNHGSVDGTFNSSI